MTASDLDEVIEIERESFAIPWKRRAFIEELENVDASCRLVKISGDRFREVAGYLCFRRLIDEMHILRFAVRKRLRQRGIGDWLLTRCLQSAAGEGMMAALLEVRSSNQAAIKLYEKLDFKLIGKRPDYYPENREDALVMMKQL